MAYLYLLSESDNDDAFYKACIERITGKTVELISRRLRRGGGLSELRSKSRILLGQIKHTGYVAETFFLIALDNDRSPVHPTHEQRSGLSRKERQKVCRYCKIDSIIQSILGERAERLFGFLFSRSHGPPWEGLPGRSAPEFRGFGTQSVPGVGSHAEHGNQHINNGGTRLKTSIFSLLCHVWQGSLSKT